MKVLKYEILVQLLDNRMQVAGKLRNKPDNQTQGLEYGCC